MVRRIRSEKREKKDKADPVLAKRIESVLDMARPALQAHRGNVALKSITGNDIVLEIQGTCVGCPMSQFTFGIGIERLLREHIPNLGKITYL